MRGTTSDAYWNLASPWGGTTVATLIRAVLEHPHRLGDPVAITVNYCAPVKRGDFVVRARQVHATRSTQHWSIEMTQEETRVVATATAVFGVRRESWSHRPVAAPAVPPPETLERMPPEGRSAWLQHYDLRFVRGMPGSRAIGELAPGELGSALSQLWLADVPARPMDFVSLTALTDSFFLRVIHVRGFLAQMGTVTMNSTSMSTPRSWRPSGPTPCSASPMRRSSAGTSPINPPSCGRGPAACSPPRTR